MATDNALEKKPPHEQVTFVSYSVNTSFSKMSDCGKIIPSILMKLYISF